MGKVILKDTSLCAIVRDEKMNPAGGIKRFIDSHVPFVEQAVIADTGSVDGTREILEEMQGTYKNLKVVDIPFLDYADARNKTMKHVETKRVLVLDADELLTHEKPSNDFSTLMAFISSHQYKGYNFKFLAVPIGENSFFDDNVHPIRLFDKSENIKFTHSCWECLVGLKNSEIYWISDLFIKHFLPSTKDILEKRSNWYSKASFKNSPSKAEGFKHWKRYNPARKNYL
jgi:glycosyltransferase involved in cell wall biosynthesis